MRLIRLLGLLSGIVFASPSAPAQQASPEWKDCISGEPAEQIRACTQLIRAGQSKEGLSGALQRRGFAYLDQGDMARALRDFDEAIRVKPDDVGFYSRGKGYRAKGDPRRAIQDFDQAIFLNPANAFAFAERAKAYRDLGNSQQAIHDFDESLRLSPRNLHTRYNRGLILRTQGKAALAAEDFDAMIQRADELMREHPDEPLFLFVRGLAKQGKGDEAGGARDIAAATAAKPKVSDQFWRLAR